MCMLRESIVLSSRGDGDQRRHEIRVYCVGTHGFGDDVREKPCVCVHCIHNSASLSRRYYRPKRSRRYAVRASTCLLV